MILMDYLSNSDIDSNDYKMASNTRILKLILNSHFLNSNLYKEKHTFVTE